MSATTQGVTEHQQVRPADIARLVLGAGLLAAPAWFASVAGSPTSAAVRRTIRILGVRYLVQAAAAPAIQQPWVRPIDTGVDLVHAVSMLAFAHAYPSHRRLAHLSALTALGFAGLDATETTR